MPVTLVGSGWTENLALGSNVTIIDSVSNDAMTGLYAQAKIVINLNASNGSSERLFEAMAAGAAVVSDKSAVLAGYFKDGREIVFFDRKRPSSVVDAVTSLLERNRHVDLAVRGQQLVVSRHTWARRVDSLVDVLDALNP